MLEENLCQIGLTLNESKIYLELLKFGSQPVSIIASRLKLNRSSSYSDMKSLFKKGFVSSFRSASTTLYTACDPNVLIGYVDQQCSTFAYYKSQIKQLLPSFRALSKNADLQAPVISYYNGIDGIKNVLLDSLSVKGVFRSYFAIEGWFKCGLGDFLVDFNRRRIKTDKVALRSLVCDTPFSRKFCSANFSKNDLLTQILFVDNKSSCELICNEMNIYNDKVCIFHLNPENPYCVVIQSQAIASLQKMLFDKVCKCALISLHEIR